MIPVTSAEVYTWFFIHIGVLLVAASCMATGLLLLSLSAGTAKLMSRLRRRRGK